MTLKSRILLLSLLMVHGLLSIAWFEHRVLSEDVEALTLKKQRIEFTLHCSELMHQLEQERGVTAASAAQGSAGHQALHQARLETDAVIAARLQQGSSTEPVALCKDGIAQKISQLRSDVDHNPVAWRQARDAYSKQIAGMLDAIASALRSDEIAYQRELNAIVELLHASESLALIRGEYVWAMANGTPLAAERNKLIVQAILYRHFVREFERDANDAQRARLTALMQQESVRSIDLFISGLTDQSKAQWDQDHQAWWSTASLVVDGLHQIEIDLLHELLERSRQNVEALNNQRLVSICAAALVGTLVLLVAWLTIRRVISSLGELLETTENVIKDENFALRLTEDSGRDEFTRVAKLVNNLIAYSERLLREKEKLASTDTLTGIMNRRSFLKYVEREISRSRRRGNQIALLFFDIDHFKKINDSYGHAVGDEVLKNFVQVLLGRLRGSDLLARWGGEEFVILAPDNSPETSVEFAWKICKLIQESEFPAVGKVTCSIGVAVLAPEESFEALCSRADAALYQAKHNGRNTVCYSKQPDSSPGDPS